MKKSLNCRWEDKRGLLLLKGAKRRKVAAEPSKHSFSPPPPRPIQRWPGHARTTCGRAPRPCSLEWRRWGSGAGWWGPCTTCSVTASQTKEQVLEEANTSRFYKPCSHETAEPAAASCCHDRWMADDSKGVRMQISLMKDSPNTSDRPPTWTMT